MVAPGETGVKSKKATDNPAGVEPVKLGKEKSPPFSRETFKARL
jgi:hypothetical protein